jgi:hypothetical protein
LVVVLENPMVVVQEEVAVDLIWPQEPQGPQVRDMPQVQAATADIIPQVVVVLAD